MKDRLALNSLLRVTLFQLRRMRRRPLYVFCLLVAPLLSAFLLLDLLGDGQPVEMPVAVVDLDNTPASRQIIRHLDAYQHTNVTMKCASMRQARRAMQQARVYGIFLIPAHFADEASAGRRPKLSFYTNYAYIIAGSMLYQDMKNMAELVGASATLQSLQARGASSAQAMAYVQPLAVDKHPVANPWLNYSVYLSNILIPGVLGLLVFILTAYTVGIEVKEGSGRHVLSLARGSIVRAITGKLLPQTVGFLSVGYVVLLVLYGVLGFPCHSGPWPMVLLMTLFVLACQGVGIFFFGVFRQMRFAMSLSTLWGVVSFSICGMSFPVIAMHPSLQALARLFPLHHYLVVYADQALGGRPLFYSLPSLGALLLFTLVPFTLVRRMRRSYLYDVYMP